MPVFGHNSQRVHLYILLDRVKLRRNFTLKESYCGNQMEKFTERFVTVHDSGVLIDIRNPEGYDTAMIKSFKHKGLENFFYKKVKKGIRPEHADRLERVLDRLNAADEIRDMDYPGSNLHKLAGDKKGQYAVKVSGNWRVFFEFVAGDAYIVDYDDYH